MKVISFLGSTLNPVEGNAIVVSSFSWILKVDTTEPLQMVLNVCIKRDIAGADSPEFPVYVPAGNVYRTPQHEKLLEVFHKGQPFTMIRPVNLRVHSCFYNDCNHYFGNADNFEVI